MPDRFALRARSLLRIVGRFLREVRDDDVLTLAAGFAYHLAFCVLPLALIAVTLLPYAPVPDLDRRLLELLSRFMPAELLELLREEVLAAAADRDPGLFTLAFALAIWTSSSATRSAIKCLNRAYDVQETRPGWRVRARAIALTGALGVLLLASLALIAFGPAIGRAVGLGGAFEVAWRVARWPASLCLASFAASSLYYFGPNVTGQRFRWLSVGGGLATIAWVAASHGIAAYARNLPRFDPATGLIGVVMFFMLWFYMTGLAFLLGGELNAVIEQELNPDVRAAPAAG